MIACHRIRHRLSLDDDDLARLVGAQKAIVEGRIQPNLARYDRMRRGIDRALEILGIDTDGPEAVEARADARGRLDSFETIEGRAANGEDIDGIVGNVVDPIPFVAGNDFNSQHIVLASGAFDISPHALLRMQQRGITAQQLQEAINGPNKTTQPNGNVRCTGGGITVILSPAGRVITCY